MVNRSLKPDKKGIVLWGSGVWRYNEDDRGQPVLKTNYSECKLEDEQGYIGVVKAIIRKFK